MEKMNWKESLNAATDSWSRSYPGESEIAALNEVCRVVREINMAMGCQLIEPTHGHMERINQEIGDVDGSMSLEELVTEWNSLSNTPSAKTPAIERKQPTKTVKKLYKYQESFGRMGDLDGVFVLDQEQFNRGMGMDVNLGEVLGKHSDITATIDETTVKELTDDQEFIERAITYGLVPSGTNPFARLEEER